MKVPLHLFFRFFHAFFRFESVLYITYNMMKSNDLIKMRRRGMVTQCGARKLTQFFFVLKATIIDLTFSRRLSSGSRKSFTPSIP